MVRAVVWSLAGVLCVRQGVNGLLLREEPDEAEFLTAPEGIAFTGDPSTVECSDDTVDISKKEILATIFQCGLKTPAEKDMTALCQPYMQGGCDNEVCHKFCHKNYVSHNEYMDCKCKHWGPNVHFKDYSAGAPCPLKIQPRCYKGTLYRSQCEAQHANPDVTIDDFVSVKDSQWPEGDMSGFLPGAC